MPVKLPIPLLAAICLLTVEGRSAPTDVERANQEGILLVGNNADPKALDPQLVTGVVENKIISALFEGLCGDHPSEDNTCTTAVAKSWTPNADFTEWTFELNPAACWSDGVAITSADFLFSYHRMLHPDFGAPYVEMLYFIEGAEDYNKNRRGRILFQRNQVAGVEWGQIKDVDFEGKTGLDSKKPEELDALIASPGGFPWPNNVPAEIRLAMLKRLRETAGLDLWELAKVGVSAPRPETLVIKLREKVPFLPTVTRHYTWFPVPKHVILAHGKMEQRFSDWTRPENMVTNGPFILDRWALNHYIECRKNQRYWDAANVSLNAIRFFPTDNAYAEARAFLAGQLHTTYSLPADQIPWVKKNHPQDLQQDPYIGSVFVRFNVTRAGLSDARIRSALSLAIHRKEICDNILEGYQPADTLTPPMGDYRANPVLGFDPAKAKQLLADAGFPGGRGFPRFKMLIGRASGRANAEAIASMWRQHLGIIVDLQSIEWSSFLTKQQTLDFDIALAGWIGDYLDPSTFLYMWTEGNGNNNTGWHDKEFEDLLKSSANLANPRARLDGFKKAEAILMRDQPIIPVAWFARNYLHHPDIKGWHPLLLDNHPWKAVRLESAAR